MINKQCYVCNCFIINNKYDYIQFVYTWDNRKIPEDVYFCKDLKSCNKNSEGMPVTVDETILNAITKYRTIEKFNILLDGI